MAAKLLLAFSLGVLVTSHFAIGGVASSSVTFVALVAVLSLTSAVIVVQERQNASESINNG